MDDLLPDGDAVTVDHLAGTWRIHQLRRGHRWSSDDLLTAWTAAEARPGASHLLDLGAGIGSVGLLTLWRMGPEAHLTMVEVQEISHRLARRTVADNDLADRVELRLGDLRDPASVPEQGAFDLVTGSPPYIPVGEGKISPHPQRAGARMELRGDVFDYCQTAARALAPGGTFCFVHAAADPRPEQAVAEAGLRLAARRDVVFRWGDDPLIALFTCDHRHDGPPEHQPTLHVRGADGRWTEEYLQLREAMGTERDWRARQRAAQATRPGIST